MINWMRTGMDALKYIQYIDGIACIGGTVLGILIAVAPRFGIGSRSILLMLFPACLSAGVQAFGPVFTDIPRGYLFAVSLALITLAVGGGYFACSKLRQVHGRNYGVFAGILAVLLVVFLLFTVPISSEVPATEMPSWDTPSWGAPSWERPSWEMPSWGSMPSWDTPESELSSSKNRNVILGPAGYCIAIFMLVVAIVAISSIEQMLRIFPRQVRWELKFLLIGIGAIYGTIIYLSSRMLLYPKQLYTGDIHIFHFTFLIACVFIAFSWKRSTGKTHAVVSHSAVYSFITLLGVGAYLITSGVVAKLIGRRLDNIGLPVEVLVFIIASIGLAVLLLTTKLGQKSRDWVRLNIFAGKYDYRQAWIEAARQIRSIDSQEAAARELTEIVHTYMGADNISVWVRRWDPNRLQLLNIMGGITASPGQEEFHIVEHLMDAEAPMSMEDLKHRENSAEIIEFMKLFHGTLLVPLCSSNRIAGFITVGWEKQGGQSYGIEEREFLRVLAGYTAGEFHKFDLLTALVSAREDEAFRSFSTFVLHDLKNFASTLSYIAQNAPRHQHNPEFQKDAFQSVYETAEKMKRVCNSLRTFSGMLAADKKMCDLNQIIRSVSDAMDAGLQEHLKPDLVDLPQVFVDEAEVARVLQNLILNAREAISNDGVISVRTVDNGDRIDVVVEDNGVGMSRYFIEKELFVPFHTTKSSGLGIGLFHSKKIMDAHNGNIIVESEPGKGTKITLSFRRVY